MYACKVWSDEVPWLPHLKANFLRLLLIILFLFHSQPLSTSIPLKVLSISSEFAYIRKNSKKKRERSKEVNIVGLMSFSMEMLLVSAVPARKERRTEKRTKNTSRPSSTHAVAGATSVPATVVPSTPRATNRAPTSRTSSIISNESRTSKRLGSVYHTSDEPLSKEALYRAKFKYGVDDFPARGLPCDPISSRTAAAAAAVPVSVSVGDNRERAVVDAYKRLIDSEPSKYGGNPTTTTTRGQRASAAASKAYANSSTSNVQNVPPRSRASSPASTYSITSRTSSKSNFNASSVSRLTPANFQKIMRGAEGRAEQRMKNRSDPERKNFSYGLRTEPTSNATTATTTTTGSNKNKNKLNLSHEAMNNLIWQEPPRTHSPPKPRHRTQSHNVLH